MCNAAHPKHMKILSYKGEYEVQFVSDIRNALQTLLQLGDVVLLDINVAEIYAARFDNIFGNNKVILISPTENQKSYQQVEPLIAELLADNFKRNYRLIAIGGGITQDTCSFIASILFRGVDWIFVPTNLLAQADSCIGSKTSLNFAHYKNQLGGFHPPKLILLDTCFLQTLDQREIRSGLGEILHYFLISGYDAMERFEREYSRALHDTETLQGLIQQSLGIKKTMIECDEFDRGPRNIFNYGHSFGHALESYTDYAIPHGIAVSFGMDIANEVSVALGFMEAQEASAMRNVIEKIWWPCDFPEVDLDRFLALLGKDKKNIGTSLRFVLSRGPGKMFLHSVGDQALLRDILSKKFTYFFNEAKKHGHR